MSLSVYSVREKARRLGEVAPVGWRVGEVGGQIVAVFEPAVNAVVSLHLTNFGADSHRGGCDMAPVVYWFSEPTVAQESAVAQAVDEASDCFRFEVAYGVAAEAMVVEFQQTWLRAPEPLPAAMVVYVDERGEIDPVVEECVLVEPSGIPDYWHVGLHADVEFNFSEKALEIAR